MMVTKKLMVERTADMVKKIDWEDREDVEDAKDGRIKRSQKMERGRRSWCLKNGQRGSGLSRMRKSVLNDGGLACTDFMWEWWRCWVWGQCCVTVVWVDTMFEMMKKMIFKSWIYVDTCENVGYRSNIKIFDKWNDVKTRKCRTWNCILESKKLKRRIHCM